MIYAVVVPTKDRPDRLATLLLGLSRQTVLPEAVVVVDASEVQGDGSRDPGSLDVTRVKAGRASMTHQKNQGVEYVLTHLRRVEIVQFMDDDIDPAPDYMARVLAVFEEDAGIGGVSGVTQQTRDSAAGSWLHRFWKKAFLLTPGAPGTVRASGINAPPSRAPGIQQVAWLIGCSAYRTDVVSELKFWEPGDSYVLYEDVIFSLQVGRTHKLAVTAAAQMHHAEDSATERIGRIFGYQFVVNRYQVALKCLSRPSRPVRAAAYWWSTFGYLLIWFRRALREEAARLHIKGILTGIRTVVR